MRGEGGCPLTHHRYQRFPGGSTSPLSTAGTPALFRASSSAAESARRSLFWRTKRRTRRYTAVKGRRQCGGADWLGSGLTESNSRSEQNKEGYEQARGFHLS